MSGSRRRKIGQENGSWFLWSLGAHAVLFGGLLLLFPNSILILQSADAPAQVSGASAAKVNEIAEDIRRREMAAMQEKIQQLRDHQVNLEQIERKSEERFESLQSEMTVEAPKRLQTAQADALKAQADALKALTNFEPAASMEQLREAQDRTTAAQERAAKELEAGKDPEAEAARKAQAEAAAAQKAANDARARMESTAQQIAQRDRAVSEAESRAAAARNEVQQTQSRAAELQKQLATVKESQIKPAQEALVTAEQNVTAQTDPAQTRETTKRREEAKRALDQAKDQGGKIERDLERVARQAQESENRATQAEKEREAQTQAAQQTRSTLRPGVETARAAQQNALTAQETAAKAGLTALSGKAPGGSASKGTAGKNAPSAAEIAATQNIPQLYEEARKLEDALAGSFQEVRATDLALLQHMSREETRKLTQTTRPIRATLDAEAVSGTLEDSQGLKRQENAIKTVRREVDSMLALAADMLKQAEPSAGGKTVTVANLKAQSEHADALEAAAKEGGTGEARDLTGLMKGPGAGSGAGAEAKKAAGGKANLPAGWAPPWPGQDLKAIPGRRLGGATLYAKGLNPQWMFLDSWYLIGPWSNPGRKNLNTKFPPESVIDLDATYAGDAGRPLRWKYHQSPSEEIVPPNVGQYEIYYGYTELWLDEAKDLWVAVGSDDQSKIWINDALVWKSNDELKGWKANEGFRKLSFKKGINRILCRLENGHLQAGFSVVVCLSQGPGGK